MAKLNRNIMLNNISYLIKERNIKTGDFEAAAGVSAGYFSRLNKEGSKATPSIEVLYEIAKELHVSIDTLVSVDLTALTASEIYMLDFLEKLLNKTSSFEMIWDKESDVYLRNLPLDENGDTIHPLFENRQLSQIGETGYPEPYWQVVYNSLFRPEEQMQSIDDGFKISIGKRTTLYLMCVEVPSKDELPFGKTEFELYLVKGYKAEPLCHSDSEREAPFNDILNKLYRSAAESSKHIKIKDTVRSAIDAFMNNTEVDEDDLDGELPF